MTFVVRATEPDEFRIAAGAMAIPLLNAPPSDEAWERSRPSWDETVSFSAWDAGRCLGHAGSFLVDTVVPGGALVPTDAVSRVGVLPTARRRGIATELMTTLIRDAAARGQTLMSLRASQATIYGRFGFGVAGDFCEATLDPGRAGPVAGAATGGSFRLLEPDEIVGIVGPLYERVALRRPGVVTRPDSWTERYTRAAVTRSNASFVVVHTGADGVDDGFAQYEVRWNETATGGEGEGGRATLDDLWAADDAAELALWSYLVDLDLISTWTMDERPTDDLIRTAAADRRAYKVTSVDDEQWLRLVDVADALATRTYHPARDGVVIEVVDPVIEANNGTWRLTPDGAEPVGSEPDISADIAAISAAYLGGTSWRDLVAVGSVEAQCADAVAIADSLFATSRRPFCGSFF